jgi:peptide deformylase
MKSQAVADAESVQTKDIIQDLCDTSVGFRQKSGFGRSIAARQIGILLRIPYVNVTKNFFSDPHINPQFVRMDTETQIIWDDCFSFPSLLVRVERATKVSIEYLDAKGRKEAVDAKPDLAELLQREIDHLNGSLSVPRAVSPAAVAVREEWEKYSK